MPTVYLDHNATSPVPPEVVSAMVPYLGEHYGNPSSTHRLGQHARLAVDNARRQVARVVGADATEVFFVGGGTEANNLALRGIIDRARLLRPARRPHVVTTAVEHPAVLAACERLEARDVAVTRVGVDSSGRVEPGQLERALTDETVLVSLMLANNDVGTLQPVAEVAQRLAGRNIVLHTDAVQALGKMPLDLHALGVDLVALSAHKIGGPKGVGALVVRRGVELEAQICGGAQERGRRAGTENVAGIVGFGRACELIGADPTGRVETMQRLRRRFERDILDRVPDARINGAQGLRLPNTTSVTLPDIDAQALVMNLDLAGVACSVGSACASGRVDPSHVLLAMGLTEAEARATVRFSLGPQTTAQELRRAVELLQETVSMLRALSAEHDERVRYGREARSVDPSTSNSALTDGR
jgi:cysteine desulfurase